MSEAGRPHHRPTTPGAAFFEARAAGVDPTALAEAAERAAHALVRSPSPARAAHGADGPDQVGERVVRLAESEGIELLAELWSGAPADSLAGCLWRLYALRTWVYADPLGAADQYDAGRRAAPVARVVAGVAEPPDPDGLRTMVDDLLRGIVDRDFADVLLRGAAFARVIAFGRAAGEAGTRESERMLLVAEQLEHAGHLELAGQLG